MELDWTGGAGRLGGRVLETEFWTFSVRACPWDSLAVVRGRPCPQRPGARVLGRESWGETIGSEGPLCTLPVIVPYNVR